MRKRVAVNLKKKRVSAYLKKQKKLKNLKKKNAQKRKNIFEYLNNNAKRNKP